MLQNQLSQNPLKDELRLNPLGELEVPSATFASVVTNFAGGFAQGFSTINVLDEEPDHWAEQLANTVGFFLGFVGIIPGIGTAASGGLKATVLTGRGIANSVKILGRSIAKEEAAGALVNAAAKGVRANVNVGKYYTNVKSVPFYVSGKIMEKGKNLLSGTAAGKVAEKYLSKTVGLGTVGDILEGSANMALASAVSSWQGGVDQMMQSAAWGGFFGAGDRYISGIKALANQPFAARAVAGSLFNGLPSTAMGNPFEIQVFDYLVGGYFGTEMPYTQRKALEIINKNYKKPEDAWTLMTGMRQLPEYVNAEQLYGDHANIIREELNNQARLMFGKEGDHNTVVGMSILHSIRNEAAQKLLEQDPNMQQSAALDAATDVVLQHPIAMFAIKANNDIAKEMLMDENGNWHLDRANDPVFVAQFKYRVLSAVRAGVPPANGSAPNNNVPPTGPSGTPPGAPPGAPPAGGGGQPAPTPARKVKKKKKKKSPVNKNVEVDADTDLSDPDAGTADAVFNDPLDNFDPEAEFAASQPVNGLFGSLPKSDPQPQAKKTRTVEEIESDRQRDLVVDGKLEKTSGIVQSPAGKFGVADGKKREWFDTLEEAQAVVNKKYDTELAALKNEAPETKIDSEIQKDLEASQEINIETLEADINRVLDEQTQDAKIAAEMEVDPVAAVEKITSIEPVKPLHAIDDTRVHDSKNTTSVPQPHRVPREGLSENAQANLDESLRIVNDPQASMTERVLNTMLIKDKSSLEGMDLKDIDKRIEDIDNALEKVLQGEDVSDDPFAQEVQEIFFKISEHDTAERELVIAQQSVKDTQPKPTDNAKVLSKTADLTDIIDTAIREKIQEGYQESLVEISTSPFARAAKNLVPRSVDPDKREGMFNEILETLNDEFNKFLETPEGKRDHTIFIDELINKHADGLDDDQVKDIKKDLANIYFKIKHLNTVEQYVWDVTNGGLVQRNKMSGTKDLIEERRAPSFVDKLLTAYFEGRRSDEERKASPKYGRIHTSMVKLFESSKNVEKDGQVSTVYDINEKSSIFDGVSGMGELMGVVYEMWKMGRSEGKMGKIHMGHLKAHGKLIFYDNLFSSHEEALSFLEKSIVGTKYEADYIANRDRFVKEAQEYFTAKGKEVDPNELRQSYEEIVANEIKLFTDIVNPGKTLADLEGKGFVNDFQKLNKRMQLLHAEGYWANEAVIRNQGIDDLTDAGYSVVVINSRNKSGISKRAGVEDSFFNTEQDGKIQRVVSETETDGAVIVRQDVYDAHVKDAGYDPDSGAMKTVIADQNQTDGALLSKHAMFRATDAQQAWMRENGVHMILHDTATKQLGSRKSYDSQVVDGKLRIFDASGKEVSAASVVSPLSINSISYNLSTRETVADQLKPQGIVKQLLRNLTASNVDQRVINQVFRDYIRRSVMGDDENNTLFASAEKGDAQAIANLDVDNISIANIMKVVNGGRKVNQDLYDKVIRHIMNYTKRVDPEDAHQAAKFYEQDLNGAAKIFASLGSLKVTPSMVDHLFVRKYLDNKLRGYISDRMESPVTPYSMKSIGMPSTGWDPPPREGLFRMGKAAKDFVVKSRAFKKDMSLGELWMAYEKTSDAKLKSAIEKDMEMIVIRVPSDSVSGARVLRFDGFSDYNGTGISLHSTDMAYLGGMDLDIDSVFIYQDLGKDSVIKQNEAKVGGRKEIKIIDKSDITSAEGTKGAAKYNRKDNTIEIDRKFLQAKFAEKAWTKPRKLIEVLHGKTIESYAQALPEDQFASYKDFEDFVISHEYQHSLYSRDQFNKENPNKTKGDYETEINRRALNATQARPKVKLSGDTKYTAKDQAKSDRANAFIGRGSDRSATAQYAIDWGDGANKGFYNPDDVVFVSVEGDRKGRISFDKAEIDLAIDAGVTFVVDKKADRERKYNVGERELYKYLLENGYKETSDGVLEPDYSGGLSLQSELKRNAHQWERVLDDGTRIIQESKNSEGAEFMEVQDVPKDQKNLMSMFDPYMQIMAGKNAHKGKNAVGYAASARNKIASFWHNVGDKPMARDIEGMNDAAYERFMESNPELVRILEEYGGKDVVRRREQIIKKLNDFDLPKKERDELVKELESLPVIKITATFNKKENLDRFFAMARQAMNYAADSSDVFDMIDPAKLSDKLFSEAFDTKLNVTVTQNKQTKNYTISGIAKPREYGQHKAALDALNPYDYAKNRTLSVSQWLMNAREPLGKNDVTARTADYLFNLDHTWSTFEDGYVSGTMERKYMAKNAFIQKYQQLVNAFNKFGKKVSIKNYESLNAKQKRNQAIKEGMYSLFQFDRKLSDKEVVRLSSVIESLQARVEEMKLPGDDGRSASKRDIAKVEKQIIYMKDLMDELILQDFSDVSSYILLTRYIERAYDKINGDEKLTKTQKAELYAEQRKIMSDIAEHAFAFKRRFKSISDNVETSEHLGKVQLLDKLKEVIGDYRNNLPTKRRQELFDVLMLSSFGQQNEAVLDKISRSMALIASGKGDDINLEQLRVEQKMQYESNATAMALYVDAIGHEGVRRYMTLYDNVTTYASRTPNSINRTSIERIARIGLVPNAARDLVFEPTEKTKIEKANKVLVTKSDKNPQAMQEAKKLRQLDDEQESHLLGDC